MSAKLCHTDLMSLEDYAEARATFRARVLAHKQARRLPLGTNATLYFEDRLTMQYQIQEMLRIERIFEANGIQDELDAYNPLIPDGQNWKATFMVEFPDIDQRREMLKRLVDIERAVWLRVGDGPKVRAHADEDLDRSSDDKTSAVHFLRFELSDEQVDALRGGAPLAAGIDHANYTVDVDPVPQPVRESLLGDLA